MGERFRGNSVWPRVRRAKRGREGVWAKGSRVENPGLCVEAATNGGRSETAAGSAEEVSFLVDGQAALEKDRPERGVSVWQSVCIGVRRASTGRSVKIGSAHDAHPY